MNEPNRRAYNDLLSNEPAWPGLEAIARASGRVVVLPREAPAAEACLERLQVTTRSALGALAYETGGLLIDAGWLRLFGAGSATLTRPLGAWNDALGIDVADLLVFGDDVVGGLFAINGGALGPARGSVFYFAPDELAWIDLERGHGAFVEWAMTGDLAMFYKHLRWPGWEQECAALAADQALSLYPPPWSQEGKDVARVSRRPVSALELWQAQLEMARQLGEASK